MINDNSKFLKTDLAQCQKEIIDDILSVACGKFRDYKDYIYYVDNCNYIANCNAQESNEKNPMCYIPCKHAISKMAFDYIIQKRGDNK